MKVTPLFVNAQHDGGSQRAAGSTMPATRVGKEEHKRRAKRKKASATVRRRGVPDSSINVGHRERWVSTLGGGALILYGLMRRGWKGALLGFAGGALLNRGITGYCHVYQALGMSTASAIGVQRGVKGIKVEKSVVINKSPEELYRYWRNFENLPRFMDHLKSIRLIDDKRSHWVVEGPAGTDVEWDAEIIKEEENRMIAWRSLENAEVKNAGSVYFDSEPMEGATRIRVILNYEPPAGRLGAAVAKLFGEEPARQIEQDLQRFKQMMEQPYH